MWDRGLRVWEVTAGSGVNVRTMTDYLRGERPSTISLNRLSRFFNVPIEAILEDEYPYTEDVALERQMSNAR